MKVEWYIQSTETGCHLCVRRTVSRKHTPRKSVLVCVCVFKYESLPGFQVFLKNFTMFMESLFFFIAARNLIRGGCELLFIKFLRFYLIHKGTLFNFSFAFSATRFWKAFFSGFSSSFRQV